MLNQFSRTELLFGKEAMEKLAVSRVAVFGIGGVGGYTVEALVRSGVGAVDLIDDDKVCLTNINRQIYAMGWRYYLYLYKGNRLDLSCNGNTCICQSKIPKRHNRKYDISFRFRKPIHIK